MAEAQEDHPEAKVVVITHNQYVSPAFDPQGVIPDPLDQFQVWFKAAQDNGVVEPEAMSLATASTSPMEGGAVNIPSVRIVLLRQVDSRGFIFFTNYTSRKSQELTQNPYAALAFYWRSMHRQVRIVGKIERVTEGESDAYWASRPRGSQLGGWASDQSAAVGEGEVAQKVEEATKRFEGDHSVPRPPHWGGWRLVPDEVEFWSGKPSRLHDRIRYLKGGESKWKIERLAP